MKLSIWVAAYLLPPITFIIIDSIFRTPMFDASVNLTVSLQKFGGDWLGYFFVIITYIGFPIIPFLPAFPLVFSKEKWIAFRCTVLFSTAGYIIGILKIIYGKPRPWWVDERIKIFGQCTTTDFGNPSGHAFLSEYAILVLLRYYIFKAQPIPKKERTFTLATGVIDQNTPHITHEEHGVNRNGTVEEDKLKSTGIIEQPEGIKWDRKNKSWLAAGLTMMLLIGISRIYLGAHSFEQILLGWSYGTIFYILTLLAGEKFVDLLFIYFLEGRHLARRMLILVFTASIYALCLAAPILLTLLDQSEGLYNEQWINVISAKCGKGQESIQSMSLYLCVSGSMTFGVIIGLMFVKYNIMTTPKGLSKRAWFKRKLIALGVYGLTAVIFLLAIPNPGYIFFYLVNANVSLFLVMFFSCTVIPYLNNYPHLSESQTEDHASPILENEEN